MVNNLAYGGGYNPGLAGGFGQGGNCLCSLPALVILILIVLQFSRCNVPGYRGSYDD